MRPWFVAVGHFLVQEPLPAVIHWTSPAAMRPLLPKLVAVLHFAGRARK